MDPLEIIIRDTMSLSFIGGWLGRIDSGDWGCGEILIKQFVVLRGYFCVVKYIAASS